MRYGSLHYDEWLEAYDGLRRAAARLIHSDPTEIALMKNTSEGIATVAMGLDWKPGDRIVAFREEFPANYYPWKRLEAKGIDVTWLSVEDSLERIDEACRGARLLSISFVQFLSGYRAPLQAIGEICRRNRCIYMVDAIQGMGAFPIDVRAWGIDALAADGHKWLLGPEGCAILYISRELQDHVEPVEFGWTNVAGYNDYASRDMALRQDAGRYEPGTLNTIGCFGLRAAMEFLLEVGVGEIAPLVQNLGDRIAAGAGARGYELLGRRTPESGAGIVSFRKAGVAATEIVRRLRENGISAAARAGWVRTSPHFYISPGEIDTFLGALP
jgi:selenocysteine lyase/cysteine desulfurase